MLWGVFNQPLRLERRTVVTSATGSVQETWATLGTRLGRWVATRGGTREFVNGAERFVQTGEFYIPYEAAVLSASIDLRIVYNSDVYNVLNVSDPDGRRMELRITVQGGRIATWA